MLELYVRIYEYLYSGERKRKKNKKIRELYIISNNAI